MMLALGNVVRCNQERTLNLMIAASAGWRRRRTIATHAAAPTMTDETMAAASAT